MDKHIKKDCPLEVFRLSRDTDFKCISYSFLKNIQRVSNLHSNIEICGIGSYNKLFFLKNISLEPQKRFDIDPSSYVKNFKKLSFLFHSHCIGAAVPSEIDIFASEEACLDNLIYSVPEKNFCLYDFKLKKAIYFSIE